MLLAHYDNEKLLEQSLLDHLVSSGKIAHQIGEEINLGHMALVATILHDIGKADRIFQEKIKNNSSKKVIHSSAGIKYLLLFFQKKINQDNLFREYIEILAYSIGAHHSVFDIPYKDDEYIWNSHLYLKASYNTKKYHFESDVLEFSEELNNFIQKEFNSTIEDWILLGFKEYKNSKKLLKPKDNKEEAFYVGLYARLILSIVKSADVLNTINAFENILKPISMDSYDRYREIYLKRIEELYNSFGEPKNEINKIRTLSADRAKERGKIDEAGIYRLDLPTGAGKTQISLRYSIHQFAIKNKSRILYVTPFLSVLEQNAQVIRDIVKDGVIEYHSNIVDENIEEDNLIENQGYIFQEYIKESWDYPFVVTTMVQFANTLFKNKSSHLRRFTSLINSVIIIDEVQSLPVKVTYMFNSMMNFLSKIMKGTIIHCTATQPIYDSEHIKYPISYGSNSKADIVSLSKEERQIFERTEVYLLNEGKEIELNDIIKEIALYPQDSYLIVLNTKSSVKNLYEMCLKNFDKKVYYLSTNLCPAHRKDILKEIKEKLKQKEPIICVSTQLIEAGVDIDFNRLIRSYSGIDSIIQSIGRCNREGILEDRKGIVKLVNLGKDIENLTMLRDIEIKKKITKEIVMDLNKNYKINVSELNTKFFEKYFINSEPEMNYWTNHKGKKINLYDLLSLNEDFELGIYNNIVLNQSFREAGRLFELIADETKGIIVHYKESSKLIHQLEKSIERYFKFFEIETLKEIKRILRNLQPYTINVYNIEKLKRHLIPLLKGQILILFEGNYHEEMGLMLDEDLDSFVI